MYVICKSPPESVRGANVPPPLYPPLLATSAMCATVELKTYFLSKLRNTDEEKKNNVYN